MADDEKDNKLPQCGFGDDDILVPVSPIPGGMMCLRHTADHQMEVVALIKAEEGAPIPEDAHLVHMEDGMMKVGPTVSEMKNKAGPAQVSTPAYREGYDRIFGKKPVVGLA